MGRLSELDLRVILEQVWGSYVDPDGSCPLAPVGRATKPVEVAAAVTVTGPWVGAVTVACSRLGATRLAAVMLAIDPADVQDADVADSLGEIANILGGNVNRLLPESGTLSLPALVPAGAPNLVPDPKVVCRLACSWLDEPVVVSVRHGFAQPIGVSTS